MRLLSRRGPARRGAADDQADCFGMCTLACTACCFWAGEPARALVSLARQVLGGGARI
jgi:hypothetical protein